MDVDLPQLRLSFNRALSLAFSRKKLSITCASLVAAGLMMVLCKGLLTNASMWVALGLTFLFIFIDAAILLSVGIILVQVYRDEVRQIKVSYNKVIKNSLNVLLEVPFFSVPLIVGYLVLWLVLGLFFLVEKIPALGEILGIMLSFAPFLLVLFFILLCLLHIVVLFFLPPAVALSRLTRLRAFKMIFSRITSDFFTNILLLSLAFIPVVIVTGVLVLTAFLCTPPNIEAFSVLGSTVRWFFIMVPFAIVLAPAVSFFFNFSAEAYILTLNDTEIK